jgi:hypothetical protein
MKYEEYDYVAFSKTRQRGTGVAVVRKRKSLSGMREELREIERHLENTDNCPLNKTEYNRLIRQRDYVRRILEGNDPRFNVVGRRPGGLTRSEKGEVDYQKSVMGILEVLK